MAKIQFPKDDSTNNTARARTLGGTSSPPSLSPRPSYLQRVPAPSSSADPYSNPTSPDFLLATTATATKDRVRRVASLTEFSADFDILAELTDNRERYTVHIGDNSPQLTLYNFPYANIIAAIRAQFGATQDRPGVHPTIACAIHHGLSIIVANPDIQAFLALRERFSKAPTATKGNIIKLVGAWFNQFPLGLPSEVAGKINIRIPLDIHGALGELSNDLGMASNKIATLACLIAFSDQSCVNADFRRSMQEALGIFLEMIHLRVTSTKALLKVFGI
jgi:hypothetical protein